MVNLGTIAIFVLVAESRSFSRAAQRLGISPSGASKAVARLEERLGIRLLNRTTRSVTLTEDGNAYFERCRQVIAELEEAESAVTRARSVPRGRLRALLPAGFGKRIIVPGLPAFVARHPEVTLDVELNDRIADLAEERVDVAVRVGDLGDTRLIARRLCRTRFVTCASPGYLRRHGEPRSPDELVNHQCLAYVVPQTGRYREWQFSKDGRAFSVPVSGALNINNGEALIAAAIAGAGIVTVASFIAAEAIAAGKLRVILRDFMADGPAISVVYLPHRHLSPRVQAFLDFLVELIPADPPWERVLGIRSSGGTTAVEVPHV